MGPFAEFTVGDGEPGTDVLDNPLANVGGEVGIHRYRHETGLGDAAHRPHGLDGVLAAQQDAFAVGRARRL
nr:hypothetical protein [Rhodococcus ruber]